MMSDSFMMRSSSPSTFTSVPDHLPNSTKSPAFTSGGDALAVVVERAGADGDDFAFLRLLLNGVGDDDAAGGLLILFDAADDHAVAERTEFHGVLLSKFKTTKYLWVPARMWRRGSTLLCGSASRCRVSRVSHPERQGHSAY